MKTGTCLAVAVALCAVALVPKAASARGAGLKWREAETERAGIKIALYEKWNPADEKAWKSNGKVILLVHGATWSSKCTFDPVESYSLMETLAEQGYDVWALDLHGYGHSGKTSRDWTEADKAAQDVDAAVDYIRALRWVEKVHLFGYQWGAQPAGLFATAHPNKVGKVAFFGMRYQQADKKKQQPEDQYRQNGNGTAMLKPDDGDLEPEFVRRRAQVCLEYDTKSPNGAVLDMAQPSAVDPARLRAPTLLIAGEREPEANIADQLEFFRALGSKTRVFEVLAGLGKYANFEKSRARFEMALVSFLEQP